MDIKMLFMLFIALSAFAILPLQASITTGFVQLPRFATQPVNFALPAGFAPCGDPIGTPGYPT